MFSRTQLESAFQLGFGSGLASIEAGMSHNEALLSCNRRMKVALEPFFEANKIQKAIKEG